MNFAEYAKVSVLTHRHEMPVDLALAGCRLGIFGETGEVLDLVKKCVWKGTEPDPVKLHLEFGDVCWYLALQTHLENGLEENDGESDLIGHVSDILSKPRLIMRWKSSQDEESVRVLRILAAEVLEYSSPGMIADGLRDLAHFMNVDLEKAMVMNLEKLHKHRYPNGWSPEAADAQADEGSQAFALACAKLLGSA